MHFIHGNGELAVLAQMAATESGTATHWATTVGGAAPGGGARGDAVDGGSSFGPNSSRCSRAGPEPSVSRFPGWARVLFCHATPRSETEIFTRLIPEDRLTTLFEGLQVSVAVCGHTHMQSQPMIGVTRVVNAGSVGMPFGEPGAYWALLGPGVQLRHMRYDLEKAAKPRSSHPVSAGARGRPRRSSTPVRGRGARSL